MTSKLAPLAVLALAGCALLTGPARPDRVSLGGEELSVHFTDGVTCRAAVSATGGEGTFDGCVHPARWQVVIHKRNYLEPVFGAAVSPYATVTILSEGGRPTVFQTPPKID